MQWWAAVVIPLVGVLGGLLGVWVTRRTARRSDVNALLISQLQALYSEDPRARQTARDIIRSLMTEGRLRPEQIEAASIALRNWAAAKWELPAEEDRQDARQEQGRPGEARNVEEREGQVETTDG